MNRMKLLKNNHKTTIHGAEVYVDFTNRRLRMLNPHQISEGSVKETLLFADCNDLGKVICNCRLEHCNTLKDCGFAMEGIIDGFFSGRDAFCLSYFTEPARNVSRNKLTEDAILAGCLRNCQDIRGQNQEGQVRPASEADVPGMARLFRKVFDTYPSPVFDHEYLRESLKRNTLFKVVEAEGRIVSVASAEMDKDNMNAEITDCATYPEFRGKGYVSSIIASLERDLKLRGFLTLYSLARAVNPGINAAFYANGYQYRGRLINNCHICGQFEDMNIWVKK